MNPKSFLQIGGLILVLVGILGFVGVLGPTAEKSIFGETWWFDNGENWTHLIIGIIALIAAYALSASGQKSLAMLVGIVGVLIGIYSIFNQQFLGANLENPMDTILHIVIGVWALWASSGKKQMGGAPTPPTTGAPA